MKIKIFTLIALGYFTMFLPVKISGQITVKINNITYANGTSISNSGPIKIESGKNTRIQFSVEVNNSDGKQGGLKVYTKKSSSDFEQQQGGSETIFSGNTFFMSSRDVTLYASDFNTSGGFLYAEFETNEGSKYKSNNVSILIRDPAITNNTISGTQTIYEGEVAATLIGSTPEGGNGNYSYQWQMKTGSGWGSIVGKNSKNYSPGVRTRTTKYRRVVSSGSANDNTSNEVTVTVKSLPSIKNNSISYEGNNTFKGTTPTGGTGTYTYEWRYTVEYVKPPIHNTVYFEKIPGATGKDFTIPDDWLDKPWKDYYYFSRVVYSGNKSSATPERTVLGPLRDNTIIFDGTKMIGSTPKGGTGDYTYEWRISNTVVNGEIYEGQTGKDLVVPPNADIFKDHYKRIVKSGFETSNSSYVKAYYNNASRESVSTKIMNDSERLNFEPKVFPNPSNDNTVYFELTYPKDTNVKIYVSPLSGKNRITVFEGLVNYDNQQVKWEKPKSLPSGIYIYKIEVNGEVKTGKILFQ